MKTAARTHALCSDPEWLGRSDCRHCGIRNMMLFSGLRDEDFDGIFEPIDNLRYPVKSLFYNQGGQNNKIYSIRRGFVKLVHVQLDGSYRIVRLLGPGSVMGLEALLGNAYRHSAIALQEVDACRITTGTLHHLKQEHPDLNEKVMSHWEKHLSTADRWISEFSSGPVRSRVQNLLTYMKEMAGDEQGRVCFFGYEDMASILGTSRETFSRTLSELRSEGLVLETEERHCYQLNL